MIRILACLILLCTPAAADIVHVNPVLWHVQGRQGEIYLFGSVHLLPPDMDWHMPLVNRAMARADTFVFEVPTDPASVTRIQALMAARGMLPAGQTLPNLLPPEAQADYEAALAATHLPKAAIDRERPWLADLQMLLAQTQQQHYAASAGVDHVVMDAAAAAHKPMRYLETIDQQFALLAPDDDKLELQEFESNLKDLRHQDTDIADLIAAWGRGDVAAIDKTMNGELSAFPEARKTLLTDRNHNWVQQMRGMLDQEKHVFFITVGAGHLAGPDGVPALLRAAGYKVEGP